MSQLTLPGPAGEDSPQPKEKAKGEKTRQTQSRGASPIPDTQECLRALAQLPGLIAIGILKPAQANAIRANYQEILKQHEKSQTRAGEAGLSNADVLELARQNPDILSMLEPILTQEQIALVLKDGADDE